MYKEIEKTQIDGWKKRKEDFVKFFQKYKADISKIYDQLLSLEYNDMQPAIYTLAKIKRIIELCNYLEEQQRTKNDDNDKFKIFLLTSHSEIAARLIAKPNRSSQALVNKFFKSVKKKENLNNLIKGIYNAASELQAADTLYAIRNEYAHQGNFTGKIFQPADEDDDYTNCMYCLSKINETDEKVMHISIEFTIKYEKFLEIYCKALQNLLSEYIKIKNGA